MNSMVLGWVAAIVMMSGSGASASESITLNPVLPAPREAVRRMAKIESLSGATACDVALVPNGVLQFTVACTAWPQVLKSKQWVRQGDSLRFLNPEGQLTVIFYRVGEDVFITGRADPELLRLTILPPPAQLRLQPSIPLKH